MRRREQGEHQILWSEVLHMASHPVSSFPLMASDQADVIRIYLELMQERARTGSASEVPEDQPLGPHDATDHSWFPGQTFDYE